MHNIVDWFIEPGFRLGWSRAARALDAAVGRPGRACRPRCHVAPARGPLFGNTVATLELDGPIAPGSIFEQPLTAASMTERARVELTP